MSHDIDEQFELRGKNASAVGVVTENGFLVRSGGLARKDIVPSAIETVTPLRQKLLNEGVLVPDGDGLTFSRDHLFDSPSGAAAQVLGRSANGWIEWKRTDGATLSQVKRIARDESVPLLSESKRQQIIDRYRQLSEEGEVLTSQQLEKAFATFKERFSPAVLAGLDGEQLLTMMHDQGNRDSLAYWLEFKNDEEFDTRQFGSIAGGSALKFRLFRRKETGIWQTVSEKGNRPKDISVEEAVRIARDHRGQLIRGVELLENLPEHASDEDYALLQDQMDELAPEVSRLAWGHKYFSLICPEKLDDYQSLDWQRFHLICLLQLPPEGGGRYLYAGRYVAVAKEVGLSIYHLTASLNSLQGRWHRYWRIGTSIAENNYWNEMREQGCVAIGWPAIGDVSWVDGKPESREKLRSLLEATYPNTASTIGNGCSQVVQFVFLMSEGDIVLAADGTKIFGVGRVVGGYEFLEGSEAPHRRQVEWLDVDEWELPINKEGLQSTVREIRKHDENLLAIERRIQAPAAIVPAVVNVPPRVMGTARLTGIPGRVQSVLERKGQVILYGPPGTGKTYWAERTANDLASLSAFGRPFDALGESEKRIVTGEDNAAGLVRLCCFHPAYGYEDFIEGYRPRTVNDQVSFELRDGVFKKLCQEAVESSNKNFYLIVDEINRGDIPRIFGELLTTLEKDKRGKRILLPVSQEQFSVPRNVFLIGTMNTADRSISLLDAALRRRFGFVELMPDGVVLKDHSVSGIPLRAWFDALNARIREHVGRDARNLQIGHSYLMQSGTPLKDLASLKRAIRDDIIPLLEEYCYEDYSTLAKILGEQIVDAVSEQVRHHLFEDGQEELLIQGILSPCPEITTSTEAISSEESQAESVRADEEDET